MKDNIVELSVKFSEDEIQRLSVKISEIIVPIIIKQLSNEDELIDIQTAAKMLRRSRTTIYSHIKKGNKPFNNPIRRCNSIYFKKSDLFKN
ncbi:MAG: helix-turn-helix domain-containing protein [Chitinophagales bacterium]